MRNVKCEKLVIARRMLHLLPVAVADDAAAAAALRVLQVLPLLPLLPIDAAAAPVTAADGYLSPRPGNMTVDKYQ